jgi:hypothetical protein
MFEVSDSPAGGLGSLGFSGKQVGRQPVLDL